MSLQFFRYLKTYSSKEISQILSEVVKDKFLVKYIRSSGPGGQNVNKLNTKVEIRIQVESAEWIPQDVQEIISEKYPGFMNKDGELILVSQKTRSQHRNLEDALLKFKKILSNAMFTPEPPSEETFIKIQDRLRRANENRLLNKKFKSVKKSDRKNIE